MRGTVKEMLMDRVANVIAQKQPQVAIVTATATEISKNNEQASKQWRGIEL